MPAWRMGGFIMLAAKCPGQDRRNWKPEDIFEQACPHCGHEIEFWKTDAKRTCSQCHEQVLNPRFNLGCALWCAYADQCVGDISSIFTERPEALKDRLEIEARRFFKEEKERFRFTEEAARVASTLLETEKEADPPVVIASVLLHDVGYSRCKEEGKGEEEMGRCVPEKSRLVADQIMKDLTLPQPVREKALAIISGETLPGDPDKNARLWHDVLEITRFKEGYRNVPEEEKKSGKEALLERLKSENARRRLEYLV